MRISQLHIAILVLLLPALVFGSQIGGSSIASSMGDGTANCSTVGLPFAADANTGIVRASANHFGLCSASSLVANFSSTDVVITPNVGINYSNPPARLSISGSQVTTRDLYVSHGITDTTGGTFPYSPASVLINYTATNAPTPTTLISTGLRSTVTYGVGGVASTGTMVAFSPNMDVQGNGNQGNEHALISAGLRYSIGTGYTQSTGPVGHAWATDFSVAGPIGVQPGLLNGHVMLVANYYNGSPSAGPSGAMWLVTNVTGGGATDALHLAAESYPVDVGLGIVGNSGQAGTGTGFTTGIRIGGNGGSWFESGTSKIGTGLHVRDFVTSGITIDNRYSGATTPAIIIDSTAVGQSAALAIGQASGTYIIDMVSTGSLGLRTKTSAAATTHTVTFESVSGSVVANFLKTGEFVWQIGLDSARGDSFCLSANSDTCGAASKMRVTTGGVVGVNMGTTLPTGGGVIVAPPATETITAGATITADACSTIKRVTAASAVTTSTTNTISAPAAGNAGCTMRVCNVGATNIITLDSNANITLVGGADLQLTAGSCIDVASTGAGGVWLQTSPLYAVGIATDFSAPNYLAGQLFIGSQIFSDGAGNQLLVYGAGGGTDAMLVAPVDGSKFGYTEWNFGVYNAAAATKLKYLYAMGAEATYADNGTVSGQDFFINDAVANSRALQIDTRMLLTVNPLVIGKGDASAALTGLTLRGPNADGTTNNVAGVDTIIQASLGSGTGTVGTLTVKAATAAGGSGATLHTSANHLLIGGTNGVTVAQKLYGTALTNSATGDYVCFNTTTKEITQNASTCTLSSERYKTAIVPLTRGLDLLTMLQPIQFEYNHHPGVTRFGLSAEHVGLREPRLVQWRDGQPEAVVYDDLIPVLINSVKELHERVIRLERQ